jgi:hypothetical protein
LRGSGRRADPFEARVSLSERRSTITHESIDVYMDRERLERLLEEDRRLIEASRESRRRQREIVERLQRSFDLLDRALRRRGLIP